MLLFPPSFSTAAVQSLAFKEGQDFVKYDGYVSVAEDCFIGRNSTLGRTTIIRNRVKIQAFAKIQYRITINDDATIGQNVTLNETVIIGERARIGDNR